MSYGEANPPFSNSDFPIPYMIAAGTLTPLQSNDAIHLAVAIRLGADEIITYDAELTEAARTAGLSIYAPRR